MKLIRFITIAAALLGVSAVLNAQNFIVAVAGENGSGSTKVISVSINERTYALDKIVDVFKVKGYLKDVGVSKNNSFYALTCGNSSMWGDYYVYENGKLKKTYSNEGGADVSSMAMCVKDNDVVVAGTLAKYFNKKGYEAKMFGEVNFRRKYETEFERKSLKRERFYGFVSVDGTKTSYPEYDMGAQGTASEVFHVFDCDYSIGSIYSTGWGEREYTHNTGYTNYIVRRCARVWKDGKEVVQQYENRTSAAYNIKVMGSNGIFTSGHQRGRECAWYGNTDVYSSEMKGTPVSAEAFYSVWNYGICIRLAVVNGKLYYYCIDPKNASRNKQGAMLSNKHVYDVATYRNDKFFILAQGTDSNTLELYITEPLSEKLDVRTTPKIVCTIPANGIRTGKNANIKLGCSEKCFEY